MRGSGRAFKTGWRQDGRTLVQVAAFLHFHFGEEHGGSYGGDRDTAAFRAADTVEDVLLVAGGHDAGESGEGSADDIYAANQFIGTAIGIHAIDDHREDLKGLRELTGGQGEAALDVVEIEAVGLALAFHFVD